MKKICMIGAAIALIATTEVKAQNVHWGIEGGYNLNYLTHLQRGVTSDSRSGGFGGVLADIGGGHVTFQPGLRYIYKGGGFSNTFVGNLVSVQTSDRLGLHYIEMPLNAVWHSGGSANGFMVGGGGFVSYLVEGHDHFSITTQSLVEGAPPATTITGDQKLALGNINNGGTNRWDAGLDAFIGYQLKGGFFLKAAAEWGFVNLQRNSLTGEEYARNMNFLFSAGYMFGHTKCKDK